jgi:excisionase family DNA binding protein
MMVGKGGALVVDKRFLQVPEVAAEMGVSEETVRRWLRAKQLRGMLLSDKAGYRIAREDLEEFITRQYADAAPAMEGKAREGQTPSLATSSR